MTDAPRDIGLQREQIRPLLAAADPADAAVAYYALYYDPRRVQLTLHTVPGGRADGFAAVCQTGYDLFVPLVLVRGPVGAIDGLLREALLPGRPYNVISEVTARAAIERAMVVDSLQINDIYRLESAERRPVLNVMVQPGEGPFRFEIRSQDGRVVSAAGVNWHTDQMAEIYVYTEPEHQGRGWARAVGAACVQALLEERIMPIYVAEQGNRASRHVALALGFRETGAQELACRGQLRAR